jgi:hypothetical protein
MAIEAVAAAATALVSSKVVSGSDKAVSAMAVARSAAWPSGPGVAGTVNATMAVAGPKPTQTAASTAQATTAPPG